MSRKGNGLQRNWFREVKQSVLSCWVALINWRTGCAKSKMKPMFCSLSLSFLRALSIYLFLFTFTLLTDNELSSLSNKEALPFFLLRKKWSVDWLFLLSILLIFYASQVILGEKSSLSRSQISRFMNKMYVYVLQCLYCSCSL